MGTFYFKIKELFTVLGWEMLLVDALVSIKNWKGTSPNNFPTSFLGVNVGPGVLYESILHLGAQLLA